MGKGHKEGYRGPGYAWVGGQGGLPALGEAKAEEDKLLKLVALSPC